MRKLNLLFILFSLLMSFQLQSQCEIFDLEVDHGVCDNGERNLFVNFQHANTSDSFELRGNGRFYGTFAYVDLPITLRNIEPPCGTTTEMVAIDQLNASCKDEFDAGNLCCDCKIEDLVAEADDCLPDGTFFVDIDFEHEGTGVSFTVMGNGNNYGTFRYDALPIRIGPLRGDCRTEYGFLIRDRDEPDCVEDVNLGKVCCPILNECAIEGIRVEIVECNGDSCYTIEVDFDHENTTTRFSVSDRTGLIGFYNYSSLPITIDCFPISGRKFEFIKICDADSLLCCAEAEFEAEDCTSDCIRDLIVEPTECDSNGNFYIEYDFVHEKIGDSGFCFLANGMPIDTIMYDSSYSKLGPFKGGCDSRWVFRVIDKEFAFCNDSAVIEDACCERGQCEIGRLTLEPTDCDSNDMFYVDIEFDHARTKDSFYLSTKSSRKAYAYNELPLRAGPFEGDCMTKYNFLVVDFSEECERDGQIGPICCDSIPCRIKELVVEASECDSNEIFSVDIDFDYSGTSDSFNVSGNGVNYGKFAYSDLPITINNLDADCDTEYGFLIKDCEKDCAEDVRLGKKCCDEECKIFDLEAEAIECNGDSCFVLKINFEHEGTSGRGFDIFDRNGRVGFYRYDQLPLTIDCFPISGRDNEFIKVCDNDNPDCCAEIEIDALECDSTACKIRELIVEASECDSNEIFSVDIDFDYSGTSDSFNVSGNGVNYGKFAYSDLPITINNLDADCKTEYGFLIKDCEKDCAEDVRLGKKCCDEECKIFDLEAEAIECNGDSCFVLKINFEHEGTSGRGFDIFDRNGRVGFYRYDQLPLTIDCFPISGRDNEFIKVCDNDNPDCCAEIEIDALECDSTACKIRELIVEASECDSNEIFSVDIDFDYSGTSDSFNVSGNGVNYGKFAYSDLPITINNLDADCDTEYGFLIKDCEKDCAEDVRLGKKCCDEECKIFDLEAEAIECNGDSCFVLKINFEHEGTSGRGFDIFDRNGRVGFYRYDQLPLTIDCFPISGRDNEFIKVCDNDNPDCCAEIEIKALDCDKVNTTNISDLGWEVYYNPTIKHLIFTELENSHQDLSFSIYDLYGQVIHHGDQITSRIDVSDLPEGAYFLRVQNEKDFGILKWMKL